MDYSPSIPEPAAPRGQRVDNRRAVENISVKNYLKPVNVASLTDETLKKLMWMKKGQLPHEYNRKAAIAFMSKYDALDLAKLINVVKI